MRRDGRIEIATAAAVLHIAVDVDYLRADVRSDFVWLDVAELENDAFYQLVFLEIQLTVVVDKFGFVFDYAPRQKNQISQSKISLSTNFTVAENLQLRIDFERIRL